MLLGKAVDDFEAALGYRERALTAQQGGDLIYIVVGIMEKFGLHADEVLACIHISNISRIDPATSRPYAQDEDTGAVLRGPNYLDTYETITDIVSRV
jgi:predicted HAD superfamily Cof-like phosphohydrolase